MDTQRSDSTPPRWSHLGDQRGASLIELLIGAFLSLVAIGAIGSLLVSAQGQQVRNANYDAVIGGAQANLDGMLGQIAAASNIISETPNSVDMNVSIGGTTVQVYYECDVPATQGWNRCVRLQTSVGAALPPLSSGATVIPYIANGTPAAPVFTWSTQVTAPVTGTGTATTPVPVAPDYVSATISVPAANGAVSASAAFAHTVTYGDGALIRNVDVPN